MKILHLTLKARWYDMIEAGIKLEEYRELKKFWVRRLCNEHNGCIGGEFMDKHKVAAYTFKDFTHVRFARGGHFHPSIPQMTLVLKGIDIGPAVPEWSDNWQGDVFRIKLGEIIK